MGALTTNIKSTRSLSRNMRVNLASWCALICLMFVMIPLFWGPIGNPTHYPVNDAWVEQCREIGKAMLSYSNNNIENHNAFPEGHSSTEVFQRLLDERYCTDPKIFYIPLPGKNPPVLGHRLRPENVSFDVTCCVDANAPDSLPLVYMTGYKVNFVPGGAATPLIKPFPPFQLGTRTWDEWLNREPAPMWRGWEPGIAVFYKGNKVCYVKLDLARTFIPDFIPASFPIVGKTFFQLTPDGSLN